MPFSADLLDIYAFGIRPALEEQGLNVFRADEVLSTGPLFCKICKAIRQCGLVVIDISGANPNVMFELGMAVALEKKVILLKNREHSVPTDLAGFEYVGYHNAVELKPELSRLVSSIARKG
jgi:predicted membrane-bound spermidine synthase